MSRSQVVEQELAAGGVMDVRGGDEDGQYQAERVRDQVAFASFDLLAGVDALAGLGDVAEVFTL